MDWLEVKWDKQNCRKIKTKNEIIRKLGKTGKKQKRKKERKKDRKKKEKEWKKSRHCSSDGRAGASNTLVERSAVQIPTGSFIIMFQSIHHIACICLWLKTMALIWSYACPLMTKGVINANDSIMYKDLKIVYTNVNWFVISWVVYISWTGLPKYVR